MADVKIEGVDAIIKKLMAISGRQGKNAARRSLRKGANVIAKAAKANAKAIDDPVTRDNISKNIGTASGGAKRERQAGGPMIRVGVRGGARPLPKGTDTGLSGGNTTHWRFVEFGTSKARAQPFMRPAMNEQASAAFNAIFADLPKQLDKELAKS